LAFYVGGGAVEGRTARQTTITRSRVGMTAERIFRRKGGERKKGRRKRRRKKKEKRYQQKEIKLLYYVIIKIINLSLTIHFARFGKINSSHEYFIKYRPR